MIANKQYSIFYINDIISNVMYNIKYITSIINSHTSAVRICSRIPNGFFYANFEHGFYFREL